MAGGAAVLERTFILTCGLLLFNLCDLLGDRVEDQVLQTCVDKFERLWQFVQIDARICD